MINTSLDAISPAEIEHDPSVLSVGSSSVSSVLTPNSHSLSFAIPDVDMKHFAHHVPDKVRTETSTTLLLLRQIHYAENQSAEAESIAALYSSNRGFSAESLLRKYYAYRRTGDWKAILNKAKCGPAFWNSDAPSGLPRDFIEFWKSLCERNQRKTAPARRELIRIWQTGKGLDPSSGGVKYYKTFPGYPEWSPSALSVSSVVNSIPSGWSQANLNRHAPDPGELKVARIGREAGAPFRRKVYTTRCGLKTGQFYLFDDLQYDLLVNFPGNTAATPPLGLVCLDLLSACAIGLGFKPTIVDIEGAKRKLKERDMLWLVVDVLCQRGYRNDDFGTHLVVENGTAAIRPDFQQRIAAATAGKVQVDRAGLSRMHLPGLFEGQSKGNPRFKAALESLINLIHNEQGMLPAQTGMDYAHRPVSLAGAERYNKQLLKLADRLPEHRRALLQFPVMTFHQFVEVTLDIFKQINDRTDHELEGWEKCRFIEQEYFLSVPSVSGDSVGSVITQKFSEKQWLALAPHQKRGLKSLVNATARQLSPQEVWNRHANELQKLGEEAIPMMLGPDFGEERQVKGGYLAIENRELDSEPIRFPAHPHRNGDKFLVYLNPHNPDRLILTDAKGRYIGGLDRQYSPCRADVDKVHAELGAAKREEAARLAPVVTRALPLAAANRDMHRHNLAVIDGQPVTPEELESARTLRAMINKDGAAARDELLAATASTSQNAESISSVSSGLNASEAAYPGSVNPDSANPEGVPSSTVAEDLNDILKP